MTQSLPVVSGRERRRYTRRETLCRAYVHHRDGQSVMADVREYSDAGMYLEFVDAVADSVRSELAYANVTVELAPTNASQAALPVFAARVAHLSPTGLGLSVEDLPAAVLDALRKASIRVGGREHTASDVVLSTQQAKALQAQCSEQHRVFVNAVALDFLHKSPTQLREKSEAYSNFSDRSALQLASAELTRQSALISAQIWTAVTSRIRLEGRDHDEHVPVSRRAQLALMGDTELDDFLLLTGVIARVDERFLLQLHEIERRYGRLVHVAIERKNNPYSPEVVCRGVQTALKPLDFNDAVWSVLYEVLEQSVTRHGDEFYRQLNSTLAGLRTIAAPSVSAERAPPRPLAKDRKSPQDVAEMADTLNRLYLQNQIAMNPSFTRAASAGASASEAAFSGFPNFPGIPTLPVTITNGAAGIEALATAQMRPAELLNLVQQLKGTAQSAIRSSGLRAADGTGAGHPGVASMLTDMSLPEASLEELLAAIDGLPQTVRASQTLSSIDSLAQLLNERLSITDPGKPKRVPAAYRDILDASSTLFARARADFAPTSVAGALVKKLERTLLKLSLKDGTFPSAPLHPARRVVNLIDQYAMVADDTGKFFDKKLEGNLVTLVDRICKRADADPRIFQVVGDSLDQDLVAIREARRDRVERLQEAFEARDRIRVARTRVDRALEKRLSGSHAPRTLLRLLDSGWRHYLTLLAVREGPEGVDWTASLAIVNRLLGLGESGQAESAASAQVARDHDIALLSDVERKLATVMVNTKEATSLMDELAAVLASDLTGNEDSWDRVSVPHFKSASDAQATVDSAADIERPRVGEWWDFVTGTSRIPMQLVWMSAQLPNCAFANRSATNKLELTFAELVQRQKDGSAKPTVDFDVPVLDRTEHSLFDEAYERLVRQALHDPVTNLLNRKGFMLRLAQMVAATPSEFTHTLCIIEFDEFRMIANTCGVEAVEKLASGLADKLREHLGASAIVGALREDTVALLLQRTQGAAALARVETLVADIKDYHFRHAEHGYSIGVSVGVGEYAPAHDSAVEALRRADAACSAAKSLGRNRVQTYELTTPELRVQESQRAWAGRVDAFLSGSGLFLRAQMVAPITASGNGSERLPYYEILLGIESQQAPDPKPADFVAMVERMGRSHDLDIWVIENAFDWIAQHRDHFDKIGGVSINLSAQSLSSAEVKACLHKTLSHAGVPADKIIFEITETVAISSYAAAQDFIREIRRYGCRFSLDDFGSGFTSYAHLKNLNTDVLKIDGSFVTEMLQNPSDLAMVRSMNDLAHALGMVSVAEWVESPELLAKLTEIGVDYAQGYAVHRPCRLDQMEIGEAQVNVANCLPAL